ncbi:16S rRNA (guanine(527)-N(7))-methyltransferase RsmG [bacterium]|nr:16S rRNA (guanine(527)-N(7))-methyltransferase RsmG [bacterium]
MPKYFWQKIDEYVNLIEGNAEKFGLVALREVENLWRRHILDSLAIFLFYEIERGDNVLDYGSGGGFPGIVLALARPGAKFTLAESNSKKAEFLKFAAEKMGLENAKILPNRVKSVLKKLVLVRKSWLIECVDSEQFQVL